MKRLVSVFFSLLFTSAIALGQSGLTVEGTVTDTATGKPIPNAIVTLLCKDTTKETHTNADGKYLFGPGTIDTGKIYILYAHCDNPAYGGAQVKEVFFSTIRLKGNPRRFIRDIEIAKNGVKEPYTPSCKVYFELKKNSILEPDKDSALNTWANYLLNNPTYMVYITGFADKSEFRKKLRLMLAKARAQECIDYIHTKGVEYYRMKLAGDINSPPQVATTNNKNTSASLNSKAEIMLRYQFAVPPSIITIKGNVMDSNTNNPVFNALIQFTGNDGTKYTTETDEYGNYSIVLKEFDPLVTYYTFAEALGYYSSEGYDTYRISIKSADQIVYTHNFLISKNALEKSPLFPSIIFDSASSVLSNIAMDTLKSLKKIMDSKPGLVFEFMGDADWHEPGFVDLATLRAQVCVNYMISLGIDKSRFIIANRLNMKGVERNKLNTPRLVKHKENQTRFNPRASNVAFWPINWGQEKYLDPQ